MSPLLQILLCIALIIFFAKVCGSLSARAGLPLVLGELLAGVILGPTLLNIWSVPWLTHSTVADSVSVVSLFKILAQIGVILLMFVAGLETDSAMMRSALGPAFWAAAGGVALPMAGGIFLARQAGFGWQEAVFIGTILTATSVTITAQTLMNLKRLRSRAGSAILGAAVIDDVMGLVVLSLVIAIAPQIASANAIPWRGLAITFAETAVCLAAMFWLGPRVTRWVFGQAGKLHGHHTDVAAGLIVAFVMAIMAQWLGGVAAITGAYLAGLFVATTPAHQKISQDLQPMVNSFFGPIFFVSIGIEVNARNLTGGLSFFFALLLIAVAGKIAGCGLGALARGFSFRESLIVGVGMIPRGEVGLITASIGLAASLVNHALYAQVILLVLITTLITPPLLHFAFPKDFPLDDEVPIGAFANLGNVVSSSDELLDA